MKRVLSPNLKIEQLTLLYENGKDNHGNTIWRCLCDCGNECDKVGYRIGKYIKNCGKHKRVSHNRTHNMTNTRIYNIWCLIKKRCDNSKNPNYLNYGGRGITYCKEWNHFESFYEWAINNGYNDNLSIDRINVNGNYCPENCRWTTWNVQVNNRRNFGKYPYYGLVRFGKEYQVQLTHNGEKVIIGRTVNINDVEKLLIKRNQYIDDNKLLNAKNSIPINIELIKEVDKTHIIKSIFEQTILNKNDYGFMYSDFWKYTERVPKVVVKN